MKRIIERLQDRLNVNYIIVKDFDINEYYLLLEYRDGYSQGKWNANKPHYKVEVKGLKNIATFISNNGLEFVDNKEYNKNEEVKNGKNRQIR